MEKIVNELPAVVSNEDAAKYLNREPQTLRKWSSLDSAPFGIRPIKIHGRLSWRIDDLKRVLGDEK